MYENFFDKHLRFAFHSLNFTFNRSWTSQLRRLRPIQLFNSERLEISNKSVMFSHTSRIVFSLYLSQTLIQHLSVFSRGIIPSAESKTVKRNALTYPPSSLIQVTLGVSVEGDVEKNLAGFSLALQHNAKLPEDAGNFFILQGASFRDFSLYDHLRKAMTRYGFNGLECLKKMICQIAEAPLKGGILEDIITFALTPSKHGKKGQSLTGRDLNEDEMDRFLEPEAEGKSGKNCTLIYSNCNDSPLDFFTHLETF